MMILKETILKNVDNSGVIWSKCLNIEMKGNKKIGRLGDRILLSIFRSAKGKLNINFECLYKGLLVGLKRCTKRRDGTSIKYSQNKVLLLSEQLKFLGTRVYGPIPKEIINTVAKEEAYKKIVSYSWVV